MKPYPKGREAREVPITAELAVTLGERRPAAAEPCGVEHTAGICRS